jgi:glutaredoxin
MSVPDEEISFYWVQGCGNCTRLKGYLTSRGIPFKSINVQADPEAFAEMKRAGHMTIPAVRKGDSWISGDLDRIDQFLGLSKDVRGRDLSPEEMVERCAKMLDLASDLAAQLPPEHYDHATPTMDKFASAAKVFRDGTPLMLHATFKGLVHHLAQHGEKAWRIVLSSDGWHELGFTIDGSAEYNFFGEPEACTPMHRVIDRMRLTSSDLRAWLKAKPAYDLSKVVETHKGERSMHKFLQTQTISLLQHTRQLEEVIGRLGIQPAGTVKAEDLEGLIMPDGVWE